MDREYRDVKPARIVVDTPDKENAVFRARQEFPLRDDDPDAAALTIATEILGGGSGLANRLMVRLRQKDGLSYGVGAGLALGSRERLATFTIGGIAAPQNVNRAEQALREELERARKEGFTAAEVDDAKKRPAAVAAAESLAGSGGRQRLGRQPRPRPYVRVLAAVRGSPARRHAG